MDLYSHVGTERKDGGGMNWHLQICKWLFFRNGQLATSKWCDMEEADRIGLNLKCDYWKPECP